MQQEEGQALCQAVQLAAAPCSPPETGAGAAKCIRSVFHASCTLPSAPRYHVLNLSLCFLNPLSA